MAWGLFVPLLMYLLGPQISAQAAAGGVKTDDAFWAAQVPRLEIHRAPIAVGGMLVGAATTLFKMRKNLAKGLGRAVKDLQASASASAATSRLDRDMNMRVVFGGLGVVFLAMIAVYFWFSGNVIAAIVAAIVMAITGFFFAAVSGNLVGMIGSSNNPISGLTLSTLIIAALLMVAIGVRRPRGGRRAGRRRGRLHLQRGGRRDAPGSQGGPPARRHAGEDAVGRFPRHRGRRFGDVLPAALLHQANITRAASASATPSSPRRRPG